MAPKLKHAKKGKPRGKLKYKDVVKTRSEPPRKVRQRKTYSIMSGGKVKANNKRRKEVKRDPIPPIEVSAKRARVEQEESSDESENEVEDHVQLLRDSFGSSINNKKRFLAIESEDSSSESDDAVDVDNVANVSHSPILENNENDSEININDVEEVTESVDDKDDPFIRHVCYPMSSSLLRTVQQHPVSVENIHETWPVLGKMLIQIPRCDENEQQEAKSKFGLLSDELFTSTGTRPIVFNPEKNKLDKLFIKTQIKETVMKANESLMHENDNTETKFYFTPLQNEIFSILNNYQDFYYPQRTFSNADELRYTYCIHATNHVLKTRTKVIHHNAKLQNRDDVPDEFRDQGLVRPKILILVPFRSSACKIIQTIINIVIPDDKGNVINKIRFNTDFTGNEIVMPKKNPKPEDFEHTFAGNSSDDFKIGISITKKSIKLYADFYSSDIIVASPLGLRVTIGAEGEPDRDFDFLASIEMLIMDQTEIFFMQNWDHLLHILKHMHLQPKDAHGTDFSRVRLWSLEGHAKYYRQTMIFSSVMLPEINSVFNKWCFNYAGKVKVVNPVEFGTISQVFVQLPHVFQKFDAHDVAHSIESRFQFFIEKILPQQTDSLLKQTLIYVPSYFDYVRLRNYFKKEDVGFVQICEYTKDGKVARARDMFFHGDAHFLLYTERYHFYNRVRVKGIRHLVFYQLPNLPHFYSEMCNLMQEMNMNRKIGSASNMTVTVLYSKYDVHQLAAVVGSERAAKMCRSDKNVHMMLTGG